MDETTGQFSGFQEPLENWSKLPHQLIDELPNIKTVAELKIILYVIRHTWGYHDEYKLITLDEFQNGRKLKNGERIDGGTGLSRPSIVTGIRNAVAHGYLFEFQNSEDKARKQKYYSLTNQGLKVLTSEVKSFNLRGKKFLPRTEKETNKKDNNTLSDSVFEAWAEFFPDKPQPRRTAKQKAQVARRLKSPHFRDNFRTALQRAAKCDTLHREQWFHFGYLVRNDDNIDNMLNGWMEWKDQQLRKQQRANQPNKNDMLEQLLTLIEQYGRFRWRDAESKMTPLLKKIINEMGGWGHICSLSEKAIRISFYQSYQGVQGGLTSV